MANDPELDFTIRKTALDHAGMAVGVKGATPELIVEAARQFERFLRGQAPAIAKTRQPARNRRS